MKTAQEDVPSSQRTGFSPLLYVAVAATFLLLAVSFRTIEEPGSLAPRGGSALGLELSSASAPVPETPELMFVAKNTLRAATPPLSVTPQVLGAIVGQLEADIRPEVARYIVEEGDTSASIAEQFDISLSTIFVGKTTFQDPLRSSRDRNLSFCLPRSFALSAAQRYLKRDCRMVPGRDQRDRLL